MLKRRQTKGSVQVVVMIQNETAMDRRTHHAWRAKWTEQPNYTEKNKDTVSYIHTVRKMHE